MQDQILESIKIDLASFCDPVSTVDITPKGASWKKNRKHYSIIFTRGQHEWPDIQIGDSIYLYREFFASEHMADLAGLAEGIKTILLKSAVYVDSNATLEEDETKHSALDLINACSTRDLPFGATRILFVRGGAGAGKTMALRQLTSIQADKILSGDSTFLYFYVDAQARALARLDEAVALLLQDIGARFTYRALATLTRLGLIVPIIDGFDELLGARGYGEAFDSLAKFIARLEGKGAVVASARSTFYEYRNFQESANRFTSIGSINFELTPIDIQPWEQPQIADYIEKTDSINAFQVKTKSEAAEKLASTVGDEGQDFLKTPFFVATIIKLIKEGREISTEQRIIPQVIGYFIDREKEKLRDSTDQPIFSTESHHRFLEMLAEEMWWQESRELDAETVKTIAELVSDMLNIDPRNRVTVVERAPSYAFFESKNKEGRSYLTFSHEFYYSFFLAKFLQRIIIENQDISRTLSRSRMSTVVGDEFGFALLDKTNKIADVVNTLSTRRITSITRETNKANAGFLFFGLIKHCSSYLVGKRINEANFVGLDFSNTTLTNLVFSNCDFLRVDFRNAQWDSICLNNCTLSEIIVDESTTRFPGLSLTIGKELNGIVKLQDGQEIKEYSPQAVALICNEIGIQTEEKAEFVPLSKKAENSIKLLKRFLRAASRFFYLSDDDLKRKGIQNDANWPELEELLIQYQIFETKSIERKGPDSVVRKLNYLPADVEAAESGRSIYPELLQFWDQLKSFK